MFESRFYNELCQNAFRKTNRRMLNTKIAHGYTTIMPPKSIGICTRNPARVWNKFSNKDQNKHVASIVKSTCVHADRNILYSCTSKTTNFFKVAKPLDQKIMWKHWPLSNTSLQTSIPLKTSKHSLIFVNMVAFFFLRWWRLVRKKTSGNFTPNS